ncbi:OmpH family outer membrane protein [Persicobacter sp. CCB-QB2]|uniref:OmpH family outer membrane protein n=1 Tax=Persicobacter sp. CCB-QB2 TaxID=1561025 RepID=UPI000AD4A376
MHMNKLSFFFCFLACLCLGQYSWAQKFGYVDTEFILTKIPEYQEAQSEINKLSETWQKEIAESYKDIQAKYDELQAEEVLLTAEMKEERLKEIQRKEEEVKAYHKKVFGFEGMFFLKKKELIKPVQDKVFEAVSKVAKEKRLQVIFDKSGTLVMIYTDPIHDYTDYVLEELGLGDPNDTVE